MKNKLWLLHLPLVALFAGAFSINQWAEMGELKDPFLREVLYPPIKTLQGYSTDLKFKVRGPQPAKNRITIVAIDDLSLSEIGRWPWRRDYIAEVLGTILQYQPKALGIDIVFSEPSDFPQELRDHLLQNKMEDWVQATDFDGHLGQVFEAHQDRVVLGWMANGCQPRYDGVENCPPLLQYYPEEARSFHAQNVIAMSKFGFEAQKPKNFDITQTPLFVAAEMFPNIDRFTAAAKHAGSFNVVPDPDGFIRRTPLFVLSDGQPMPTLAMAMAEVGLQEKAKARFTEDGQVERVWFENAGLEVPVTPSGSMEINFRGPAASFHYLSVMDLLSDEDQAPTGLHRELASVSKFDLLNDAYVFVGLTALGAHDVRAFPFDERTPGTEGHASILDNILSRDPLLPSTQGQGTLVILVMMILGAVLFGFVSERLEAIPSLLLFVVTVSGLLFFDLKILFENQINWNLSLLYLELSSIFVFTIAAKWILEEKDKKFIRGAMGKYVSPKLVEELANDPSKLVLGGEKKPLTILFSDIRGFTTLSEKMDAASLTKMLNDYLTLQSDIVKETDGTLDKYIGDAVMAFWGAPGNHPKHAHNALKAARLMMTSVHENYERWKEEYGIEIKIGIGLNTGTVSVGNMGGDDNFNYTVIGDHVNLASRLEGLTKPYSAAIIVTRFLLDDIKETGEELPPHRTLDFVKVKGKDVAVEICQVFDLEVDPKGIEKFKEGFDHYLKQEWDQARVCFEESKHLLRTPDGEEDGTSKMYLERCEHFEGHPPGENWDGTWTMTTK